MTGFEFVGHLPELMLCYHPQELPVSPERNTLRYIHKPLGFSYFPVELFPVPKSWVETTGNLVFWREHQRVCCIALREIHLLTVV